MVKPNKNDKNNSLHHIMVKPNNNNRNDKNNSLHHRYMVKPNNNNWCTAIQLFFVEGEVFHRQPTARWPIEFSFLFSLIFFLPRDHWYRGSKKIIKTRNMGQSPTWGCPAPQVRLQAQFWVVQIPRAATPPGESQWKVVWNRAEIPLGWVNMSACDFFVCGPKFTLFFRPTCDGL